MPGVRLHHEFLRAGMFVVELPEPLPGPPHDCARCPGRKHSFTAMHMELDDGGNVMVSKDGYEALRAVGMAGFSVVNEVSKPPPLKIGGPNGHPVPIVGRHTLEKGMEP